MATTKERTVAEEPASVGNINRSTETTEPPAAVPQTAAEIAATEQALGLGKPADSKQQTLPARVPVRMGVAPTNIEEGWRLAQFIAMSDLVPAGYKGRPADVLVAIQYGMEVGLPPMAALHSIFVTNGRPSLWGDGFLAVIMASPVYRDHDEYYMVKGERRDFLLGADLSDDDTTAVATFWRKDSERGRTATFSIAKAKKAGLWSKKGPWQDYPDRMLKYRARGFAGHDAFPDVLRGIRTAEEVIDVGDTYEPPPPREVQRLSETAKKPETPIERATNDGSIGTGPEHKPAIAEIAIGPIGVKDVENFLGGYTITLADGTQVDTTEVADAVEFEKVKGTAYKFKLTCGKDADGHLQLLSFSIAD